MCSCLVFATCYYQLGSWPRHPLLFNVFSFFFSAGPQLPAFRESFRAPLIRRPRYNVSSSFPKGEYIHPGPGKIFAIPERDSDSSQKILASRLVTDAPTALAYESPALAGPASAKSPSYGATPVTFAHGPASGEWLANSNRCALFVVAPLCCATTAETALSPDSAIAPS